MWNTVPLRDAVPQVSHLKDRTAVLSVLGVAIFLAALGWLRVAFLGNGPVPAPLLFLALQVAGIPRAIWFMAGAILFLAWSPQLLSGSSRIPLRSVIGLGVLTALE